MVLIKMVNIFLIFFISISLSQVGVVKSQESNIIYVGGNSDNYSSIQLAIDNANQGDTIYINSGIYNENIVINKELLLIGANSFNTIVDGFENDVVITILSDNVEISNLTIRNSKINLTNTSFFYSGVLIDSNFNTIKGCQITDNQYAVVMVNSSENQIINCDIYENAGGLYLYNSLNNEIFNNRLNHNYLMPSIIIDKNGWNHISKCNISYNDDIGLIIRESNDNVINENIFLNNPIGIRIFETLNFSSENNYTVQTEISISLGNGHIAVTLVTPGHGFPGVLGTITEITESKKVAVSSQSSCGCNGPKSYCSNCSGRANVFNAITGGGSFSSTNSFTLLSH